MVPIEEWVSAKTRVLDVFSRDVFVGSGVVVDHVDDRSGPVLVRAGDGTVLRASAGALGVDKATLRSSLKGRLLHYLALPLGKCDVSSSVWLSSCNSQGNE